MNIVADLSCMSLSFFLHFLDRRGGNLAISGRFQRCWLKHRVARLLAYLASILSFIPIFESRDATPFLLLLLLLQYIGGLLLKYSNVPKVLMRVGVRSMTGPCRSAAHRYCRAGETQA